LPLALIVVGEFIVYAWRLSKNTPVDTDTYISVSQWRSLLSAAPFWSAFIPCHSRCVYIHGARLIFQLMFTTFLIELLIWRLVPLTQAAQAISAVIAAAIAQSTKPLWHLAFTFFEYRESGWSQAQVHLAAHLHDVSPPPPRLTLEHNSSDRKEEMNASSFSPSLSLWRDRKVSTPSDDSPRKRNLTDVSVPSIDGDDVLEFAVIDPDEALDIDFPQEHELFQPRAPSGDIFTSQIAVPGLVDVAFPGEGLQIVSFHSKEGQHRALRQVPHSSIRDIPALWQSKANLLFRDEQVLDFDTEDLEEYDQNTGPLKLSNSDAPRTKRLNGAADIRIRDDDDAISLPSDGGVEKAADTSILVHLPHVKGHKPVRFSLSNIPIRTFHAAAFAGGAGITVVLFIAMYYIGAACSVIEVQLPLIWGIAVALDATVGEAIFLALLYASRILMQSEDGTIYSELHPYDFERRMCIQENLNFEREINGDTGVRGSSSHTVHMDDNQGNHPRPSSRAQRTPFEFDEYDRQVDDSHYAEQAAEIYPSG
jgi:hypothetical protein